MNQTQNGMMKLLMAMMVMTLTVAAMQGQGAAATESLPTGLNINMTDSSVSGLSSGGFMAVQMHVAFSSQFRGVGVFAGGPYNCAEGSERTATTTCLTGLPSAPNVAAYVSTTQSRSGSGQVDAVANLASARVYLFSGTLDFTVYTSVVTSCEKYYQNFVQNSATNIAYMNTLKASHTFPTDNPNAPNPCDVSESPYIAKCNYDGAGTALAHIYGTLQPRAPWTALSSLNGTLIEFDQTPFGSAKADMADTGYVFVPTSCQQGALCRIHVALHGCLQNANRVGNQFAANTGYNLWASTNNIIVLYPQIQGTGELGKNPDSCWDWWGYLNDETTYDTKAGPQMQAIFKMMQTLA